MALPQLSGDLGDRRVEFNDGDGQLCDECTHSIESLQACARGDNKGFRVRRGGNRDLIEPFARALEGLSRAAMVNIARVGKADQDAGINDS